MLAGDRDLKFHISSLKFKAFVIESWLGANIHQTIRHTFGYNYSETSRVADSEASIAARVTFGFNSDELVRVGNARSYDSPTRIGHYPLVEWGWDRPRCLSYIQATLGVDWDKSACPFCPFARLNDVLITRQKRFPEQTAQAMFLERVALAINPRAQLYKKQPLYMVVGNSDNKAATEAFDKLMGERRWAVYRVRRIYQVKAIYEGLGKRRRLIGHDANKKGTVKRCVERLEEFAEMTASNRRLAEVAYEKGLTVHELHGLRYVTVRACEANYPTSEEFLVAAPAVVETKARYGVEHFDSNWDGLTDLYCGKHDLPLLEGLGASGGLIQIR